jgi:hypothetical protein
MYFYLCSLRFAYFVGGYVYLLWADEKAVEIQYGVVSFVSSTFIIALLAFTLFIVFISFSFPWA